MSLDAYEPSDHLYNNHVTNVINNDLNNKEKKRQRERKISTLLANVASKPDNSRPYDHSNNPLASYVNILENSGNIRNNFQTLKNNDHSTYTREGNNKKADTLNYPKFTVSKYPVYKQIKNINKIPKPVNIPEYRIPDKNKTGTYASMLRNWKNAQMSYDGSNDHLRKGYIQSNPDILPRQTEAEASLERYYIMDPLKREGERSLTAITGSLFNISVPRNNREKGNVTKRNYDYVTNPKFRDSENLQLNVAKVKGDLQPPDTKHLDINGRRPFQQFQATTWRNDNSRISRPVHNHLYETRISNTLKSYSKPNNIQLLHAGRRNDKRYEDLSVQNKNLQLSGVSLTQIYKVPFVSNNFSIQNELGNNFKGRDLNMSSSYPTIKKSDPLRSINRGIDVTRREKSFGEINQTLRYVENLDTSRVGKNRIISSSSRHQKNVPISVPHRNSVLNTNLTPRIRNKIYSQTQNKGLISNLSNTLKSVFGSLPNNEPLKDQNI